MPRLFGTDGVRGTVGEWPMVPEFALKLGQAAGAVLARHAKRPAVAVGRDTRQSGPMLHSALSAGLLVSGVDVMALDVITTPGVSWLVQRLGLAAGAVISASHNPVDQNGIKFFGPQGQKLSEAEELEIEALADPQPGDAPAPPPFTARPGRVLAGEGMHELYLEALLAEHPDLRLDGLTLVVDCANGAASAFAPELFARAGARVIAIHASPTGLNINAEAGSEYVRQWPGKLKDLIHSYRAHMGIAFDGDADRIGLVDDTGAIMFGDQLMVVLARDVLKTHPGATIIADVKASQVLFDEIGRAGGNPLMWKTGHSLIKAKMAETGSPLAGEMSGHIFFADRWYGFDDALYAGVRTLGIVARMQGRLSDVRKALPQVINTPEVRFDCDDTRKFTVIEEVAARLRTEGATVSETDGVRVLTDDGWWLLRASNTQAVLVARAEAGTEAGLERLKAALVAQLEKSGLASPDFSGSHAGH